MSLGSSDMAGSALGTALSLLLIAYMIQGFQNAEVFHYEKMEAVVGQDVVLPCTVKNSADLHVIGIEWSKNRHVNTKLVVYSSRFGLSFPWPNVTIQIENNSMGSSLKLSGVTERDSDIYICDLTTFPEGSIRRETELTVKDFEITCDMNDTVEVHAGGNVTIQCGALPNAQYRWTKNKKLLSEEESLELCWVTDAHTGVYTLTVNTGNKSLHKEFIIRVLTATTSLRTDHMTVSQQSTEVNESADSELTTSPTTGHSTIDTTWTSSAGTDATDDNPKHSTAQQHVASTFTSVTSSPATPTDHSDLNKPTDQEINPTHRPSSTFSDAHSSGGNLSTTLNYGSATLRSTDETRNKSWQRTRHPESSSSASAEESSTLGNSEKPGVTPTLTTGNMVTVEEEDTDGVRSHLLLVFVITPVLLLIAVAGYCGRKQIIKQRMDMPPSFKPPPPPVKYTAARHCETPAPPFPTSRCNSIAELKDMKRYIY